jgi:hypothetical protein
MFYMFGLRGIPKSEEPLSLRKKYSLAASIS